MDHTRMNRFIELNGEIAAHCPICKNWVAESKMRCGTLFNTKICFSCYRRLYIYMENITEAGLKWLQERVGKDKITIHIKIEKQ